MSGFTARAGAIALFLSAIGATTLMAQTPAATENTQPPTSAAPAVTLPPAAPQPAATKVLAPAIKGTPAKGRECTRLPLSDIQVGRDKTIEVARLRLDEYMAKVGKQKSWKSWDKSLETVSCEDYLNVPFLGQEYKCMVTATFCRKS